MKDDKRFIEPLDTYVFTTKLVLENYVPITFISHDEDGDWQFIGGPELTEESVIVVSLGEIIAVDSTITEMADLPLGFSAERKFVGREWKVERLSD